MPKRKMELDEDLDELMEALRLSPYTTDEESDCPGKVSVDDFTEDEDSKNDSENLEPGIGNARDRERVRLSIKINNPRNINTVESEHDRLMIDESPPPNSDELSIQISSESSDEMISVTTLDDSLSSNLVRTPGRLHEASKSSKNTAAKESDFSPPDIASTPFSKTPSLPSVRNGSIAKSLFSKTPGSSHDDEDDYLMQDSLSEEEDGCSRITYEDEDDGIMSGGNDDEVTEAARMKWERSVGLSEVTLPFDKTDQIIIQFNDNDNGSTNIKFSMENILQIDANPPPIGDTTSLQSIINSNSNNNNNNNNSNRGVPEGREWSPGLRPSTFRNLQRVGSEKSGVFKNPAIAHTTPRVEPHQWTSGSISSNRNNWDPLELVLRKEAGTQTNEDKTPFRRDKIVDVREKSSWRTKKSNVEDDDERKVADVSPIEGDDQCASCCTMQ